MVASKHKAWSGETRREMASALEGSLRRLRTDYLDIYFNHAVNDVRRLQNPEWSEFTDRAIRDGKIRFRGVSGHGSALTECLDYALDNDLADVILAAYNFAEDASFFEKLRAAVPLRGAADRARAGARESKREGGRRRRDEDVDGRAPERPAAVRDGRRHLLPRPRSGGFCRILTSMA